MPSPQSPPSKDDPILIVGAGVFGLSLAYELSAKRHYTNITVLDRYMPPVPDGSSVDVSRIIRSEYADPLYVNLATDAIKEWRQPEWASQYHEAGFIMLAAESDTAYMDKYLKELESQGKSVEVFKAGESDREIKRIYPTVQAELEGTVAIHNRVGGWAHASDAIEGLAKRCTLAGVSFLTGRHGTVVSLEKSGSRITGVRTAAGATHSAARVVLATGAWTNFLVPGLRLRAISTGQPVGFIQLTPEEAERLRGMPVMINMSTGVFCFPPTPDTHQLKLARHGYGYTSALQSAEGKVVSSPRVQGNNAEKGYLPQDAEQGLRDGAKMFFPEFGDREWARLRMCWYTDTPEGDFVVDYHSELDGLFFATGGSGQ